MPILCRPTILLSSREKLLLMSHVHVLDWTFSLCAGVAKQDANF
jgi:hypothetical protein